MVAGIPLLELATLNKKIAGITFKLQVESFFSNGGLDPWSGLGVNDTALNGAYAFNNSRGVVAVFMNHTAHHLDLRGRNDSYDPTEVVKVRNLERQFIRAWLNDQDRPNETFPEWGF